jgi:predicted HTH transcriptional regulator
MVERIKKSVREKVKSVPLIEVDAVEVHGEPVIVVNVLEGPDPPYCTHANEVLLRKGATDRRADPRTELKDLYEKQTAVLQQRGGGVEFGDFLENV